MAVNLQAVLDAPIIELDTIDSTNNYAMRLADADTAQPGLTVVAAAQTKGKGQRGRSWTDAPGDSLLMSIITSPPYSIDRQFTFSAAVATAIADVLQNLSENWDVCIKWPNDIIINDKKAGGILIENILRGNNWVYAIVGLGLNVNTAAFPAELVHATSLKLEGSREFNLAELRNTLRENILMRTAKALIADEAMQQYNDYLYRKGQWQTFGTEGREWQGFIQGVSADGRLQVQLADGETAGYVHGVIEWIWQAAG